MATKVRRLKNPGADVLPHMDPSYPVRPLIDTATHTRATVVILPIPGQRSFVASTLEDQKILVSASTRKGAQRAAMDAYVAKHAARTNPDEDAEDIRDFIARRKEKEYSWESVKREAGL